MCCTQKLYVVEWEPQIRNNEVLRKPNLMATIGRLVLVIDVQIVDSDIDVIRSEPWVVEVIHYPLAIS